MHTGPCSHRYTRSHKQTHSHTLQAQPTLTLSPPPPAVCPGPSSDSNLAQGTHTSSHFTTLLYTHPHRPAPTVGAGGAGAEGENPRLHRGRGCGGCAGEEMTARGPPESGSVNINMAVIKMQGRGRMDAVPGALGSAASSQAGWNPLLAGAQALGPGGWVGRRGRGRGLVCFARPSVAAARSHPRPAPGRAARQAPVSRSRPPPPSRPGDVIGTKLPLPGRLGAPESSPPPGPARAPSVCRAEPRRGPRPDFRLTRSGTAWGPLYPTPLRAAGCGRRRSWGLWSRLGRR